VAVIWGVGPVTETKLAERGVETVGDLARTPAETVARWLGPGAGRHLHHLAWNRDPRRVTLGGKAGSVGAQSALGRGLDGDADLSRVLLALCDRVSGRMRKKGRAGRTITVRVRFPDMSSSTRALTLPEPVCTTAALHHAGTMLLASARQTQPGPLTLVGVSVSHLTERTALQLELPFELGPDEALRPGSAIGAAHRLLDERIDQARARFGKEAVGRASVILDRSARAAPDAFRELAERD
jgi:DNA polymerase-4